jgi:hypothetical protein
MFALWVALNIVFFIVLVYFIFVAFHLAFTCPALPKWLTIIVLLILIFSTSRFSLLFLIIYLIIVISVACRHNCMKPNTLSIHGVKQLGGMAKQIHQGLTQDMKKMKQKMETVTKPPVKASMKSQTKSTPKSKVTKAVKTPQKKVQVVKKQKQVEMVEMKMKKK